MSSYDALDALYTWMRTSEDASAVRALIYDAEDGIYKAGDLVPHDLTSKRLARETASEKSKALVVTLHDLGDEANGSLLIQQIGVCVWDVQNGQDTIRQCSQSLQRYIHKLDDDGLIISDIVDQKQGIVTYAYRGRTGYRQAVYYHAEFDMLMYEVVISQGD